MKNTFLNTTKTITITLLFLMMSTSAIAGNKTVKIQTSSICEMCKDRIELAVNNMEGVKKSLLNLSTGVLIVRYNNDKLTEVDIKTVINNAGYAADELPANAEAYAVLPGCCKEAGSCSKREE